MPTAGRPPSPPRRRAVAPSGTASTPPPPARRPGGASRSNANPKPAAARTSSTRRGGPATRWTGRALGVAVLLAAFFVGLPVAHAVLGELGALALGLALGAFALGRFTSPHRRRA